MRSLRRLLLIVAIGVGLRSLMRRATPVSCVTLEYEDGSSVELAAGSPSEQELMAIAGEVIS